MFVTIFSFGIATIFFNMIKINAVGSTLFKISFLLIFLWFFAFIGNYLFAFLFYKRRTSLRQLISILLSNNKNRTLVILLLFLPICFFSILISSGFNVLSFSFFNQFICFFSCLFLFFIIIFVRVSKRMVEAVMTINLVLSLITILLFFAGFNRTWHNTMSWVDLNLNFQNPNPAGEFCLISFLFLIGTVVFHENKIIKVLSLFCAPIMFFFLCLTSSRAPFLSLLSSIIFVLFVFVTKKATKLLACFIVMAPIVYVFLIMLFGVVADYSKGFKTVFENYEIYGRYYLWADYLKNFSKNPLFGQYYLVGENGTISSFVNSYLMVLILFGPICYILFIVYQFDLISTYFTRIQEFSFSLKSMFPLLCFLSVFYLGLNEGGVFVGAGGLYIVGVYCSAIFCGFSADNEAQRYISIDI